MSTKKASRQSADITKKERSSHHNLSPQLETEAKERSSAVSTKKGNGAASTLKASVPQQSSGSFKEAEHVSIGMVEHHTKKQAWENEISEKEKEKAHWEREKNEWEKEKAKWEKEKAQSEKEKAELQSRLCKMEKENNTWAKQLQQDMEREAHQAKTKWDKDYKTMTKSHTKEKELLVNTIENLTAEKNNLLTKLSTIAADMLQHGNVNIADLSDADRPTKLQEVYSELYDNEWTDAFEELTKHQNIPEKDTIMILLKILMSSFQNCREITWGRYERLIQVASSIDFEQRNSLSPAKKVMNNVSGPGLTTQEAEASNDQVDKNDKKEDQSSATDKKLDNLQEEAASSENGKNEGIQATATIEKVEPGDHKNVAECNNLDNIDEAGKSRKGVENEDIQNAGEKNLDSGHSDAIGEAKNKFEKGDEKFQNRANEHMEYGDSNVSGASKKKSDHGKEKYGAKENVEFDDTKVNGASKYKSENEKGKNGTKKCVESGDSSVSGASKMKSEQEKGKNGAKENVEFDDTNMNGASKDKSENEKGKFQNHANEQDESGDSNVSGASKKKSDHGKGKNGAKENVEFDDTNLNGALKDKYEKEKGKNGAKENVEFDDTIMNGASNDKSENEKGKRLQCTIELHLDIVLAIKGIWRKTTLELKGISAEQIYSVIETCLDMPVSVLPMTSKYLKKCIDLCWKMGVQEKPLHLDSIVEMDACAGKKFDKDKFRPYTQSGKNVAFVVWPTLYLYEGGPILVKGIAQGCSSDENCKPKMHS